MTSTTLLKSFESFAKIFKHFVKVSPWVIFENVRQRKALSLLLSQGPEKSSRGVLNKKRSENMQQT